MKFILKTVSFFTLIAILLVAVWFVTDENEHRSLYNNTLSKITAKSYDETFTARSGSSSDIQENKDEHNAQPSMDEVKNDSVVEHSKRHSDPNYVCPMHPQIVKGEEGSCPICGMDLVLKEAEPEEQKPAKKKENKEKKIAYWVAPMDANFRRDEPGQSPMGMDLVPVYEEAEDDADDEGLPKISINATTAQNMGVRSVTVKKQALSRAIKTIGSVTYNEDSLHHVHVRAKGWVEKVYAKSLGDPIKQGRSLLDFYSPEIVAAQKDLILASRRKSQISSGRGLSSLAEASKIRLRDLNVPNSVINQVVKKGKSQNTIPIIAKHDGVVVKVGIRNGMYVTPQNELYTIADLSSVWVIVDVFEHQLTWVNVGDKAEVQVQGVPGKVWQGRVDYIYPELNPKTRTLKVRLKIATPKQLLKPNMFADVSIINSSKQVLSVPAEAIIYYENSPRIVKVISDEGAKSIKYQPFEIKTGMKSGGMVEIIEGLAEGDRVVASGQFMIDSESNLKASFRRLSGGK